MHIIKSDVVKYCFLIFYTSTKISTCDKSLIGIIVLITSFDIEVGKPLNCQVSVNHHIELTEEEKAQARQEAIRQYQQEQMNKMRNRDTAKRTSQRTETEVHQPSLFDTL